MSILYDAKKRKPRHWIVVAFIAVPVVIIALIITLSKNTVQEHKAALKKAESEDIFDRF